MFRQEDLTVYTGAVAIIRMHPDMYAGPTPRRRRLAGKMISDLLHFGVRSATVEVYGEWLMIVAQSDWLTINGKYQADRWDHISAAPEIGLDTMHPEVVLTAFSEVLFTIASGSIDFIVGKDIHDPEIAARAQSLLAPDFRGRAVGFFIKD